MDDILEQARRYRTDITYNGRAHYKAADNAAAGHNWLGIPVIVATAIVGTSIFATLASNPALGWKIIAGLISLVATTLAALQTFFKFSEAAERHRAAGAAFAALRRRVDLFLLRFANDADADRTEALRELEKITTDLSQLAGGSPRIPATAYRLALSEIKSEKDRLPTSIAGISGDD